MNTLKCHRPMMKCGGFLYALCFILLWSGQAYAGCVTTITATTPTVDFAVDATNGTVKHAKTGLMWKQCSEGLSGSNCATGSASLFTWQAALQLANNSTFAGFNNWRLPNLKEFGSITEEQCVLPAINATIFPATVSNEYWSASPYAANNTDAWSCSFSNGVGLFGLKSISLYVRLVRDGP